MIITEPVAGVEETLHGLQTDAAATSPSRRDAEDPAVSSLAVKSDSTLSPVSMLNTHPAYMDPFLFHLVLIWMERIHGSFVTASGALQTSATEMVGKCPFLFNFQRACISNSGIRTLARPLTTTGPTIAETVTRLCGRTPRMRNTLP